MDRGRCMGEKLCKQEKNLHLIGRRKAKKEDGPSAPHP